MQKFRKVIVSGHVIEVYEYEKEPHIDGNFDNDNYDPLDLETTKIELSKDELVEKRRMQTMRDARNNMRRLALMNFKAGDKFITLTFKENINDVPYCDDEFKKFIKRFKYKFRIDKLKYIAVREFQKRGALHFHMMCNWDKNFISEGEIREYERIIGEKIWKHGFVDIKVMDKVDNVGAYLSKYMTKVSDDMILYAFKGRKIYLSSQGLERPKVYRNYNADLVISSYGLDIKKEVYTNTYESEYLGKITYKEYNLKRL